MISFTLICFAAEEMNKADEELRETIKKLWPFQSKKMLNLLVAPAEGRLESTTPILQVVVVYTPYTLLIEYPSCFTQWEVS